MAFSTKSMLKFLEYHIKCLQLLEKEHEKLEERIKNLEEKEYIVKPDNPKTL